MVLFNYSTKELTAKIVYYGPGLCGKTTNLQFIHQNLSDNVRGKMLSLATKTDRTLFFDFLPMDLGEIRGMKTRMQLYTVPGQVFYNETRKLVLKGADGIVFVADSQKEMLGPNIEAFKNLEENLKAHGMKLAEMPHVIQMNKRDLPKLSSIEELNTSLNKFNAPFYESVATTGIGVQDSLKAITKLVLLHLTKKYDPRTSGAASKSHPVGPSQPAKKAPAIGIPIPAAPSPSPAPAMAAASSMNMSEVTEIPKAPVIAPQVSAVVRQPETIAADEIDSLMDEVQESQIADVSSVAVETLTQPENGTSGEIQVGVAATPVQSVAVNLTEALDDHDLFDDPNLEVAHLIAGDTREIVIPVQVGEEGANGRRYKLSLKLRIDSVE